MSAMGFRRIIVVAMRILTRLSKLVHAMQRAGKAVVQLFNRRRGRRKALLLLLLLLCLTSLLRLAPYFGDPEQRLLPARCHRCRVRRSVHLIDPIALVVIASAVAEEVADRPEHARYAFRELGAFLDAQCHRLFIAIVGIATNRRLYLPLLFVDDGEDIADAIVVVIVEFLRLAVGAASAAIGNVEHRRRSLCVCLCFSLCLSIKVQQLQRVFYCANRQ